MKYLGQTFHGKQENVFLEGDRGIGKSSLASFIRDLADSKYELIGIHVFLGNVLTLPEMIRKIFEEILKQTKTQSWYERIKRLFGEHIKQVGLFGISVSFNPPSEELNKIVWKFDEAIYNVIKAIEESKKGILIILDDINGLAEKADFANWYKSFVDEVATHYKKFPLLCILTGLSEKRDALATLQPSLMRVFRVVEIERLSDIEVGKFFSDAFDQAGVMVESEAMELLVKFSSGLPILMQEIGDATFLLDEDKRVDVEDAWRGIFEAGDTIGKKYLDPKIYRAIRSERYISILRKCAESPFALPFSKKDIEVKLNEEEKKVFQNFLNKLKELDIIEPLPEGKRGSYRFVNFIYPIYIWMESLRIRGLKIRGKDIT